MLELAGEGLEYADAGAAGTARSSR
jgi:hypothetical protein